MATRRLFEVAAIVAKIREIIPVKNGPVSARKNKLKPLSGSAIDGITPRNTKPNTVMEIQVNCTKEL